MTRLAAFYFAYFFALGAFSPYFAPWLQSIGTTAWQISILMSLWYGTRVFAPPLWAWCLARYGRPAWWLRLACMVTLLSFALFLLPLPFAGLLLVMLVFTSFYNVVMPQFEAITLDFLGDRRDRYARIRLWGSVGFLLANLGYGLVLQQQGYQALIAAMLPAFALLVLCAWWAPLPVVPAGQRTPSAKAAQAPLRPGVRRLLLIAFLMQVCHGPFYIYLSLFLAEHGWDAVRIGQFWALGVLAEVVLFFCMPRLLARFDAVWMLAACLAIGAMRWPLLAVHADSAVVVAATQLLHAFTFAAFHACLMQLISRDTRGDELQRVQALLYGVGSGGGGVVGAWLAGAVWLWVGHMHAFVLAGLISALSLLLVPTLRRAAGKEVRRA